MHGDEIHMVDQRRLAQPDMPGLGGRHRHRQRRPQAVEVAVQLARRKHPAQLAFVAGDHPLDAGVAGNGVDDGSDFPLVVRPTTVEPDPGTQPQAGLRGQRRQHRQFARAVGAQPGGQAGQPLQVVSQRCITRKALAQRALPALEAVVGQPGNPRRHVRRRQRRIEGPPEQQIDDRHQGGDEQRAGPA
jgi:hypothetical protein